MDTPQVWHERVILRSGWRGHALHRRRRPSPLLFDDVGDGRSARMPLRRAHAWMRRRLTMWWVKRSEVWSFVRLMPSSRRNRRLACDLPRCQFGFIVIHNTNALYAAISTRLKKNATVQRAVARLHEYVQTKKFVKNVNSTLCVVVVGYDFWFVLIISHDRIVSVLGRHQHNSVFLIRAYPRQRAT